VLGPALPQVLQEVLMMQAKDCSLAPELVRARPLQLLLLQLQALRPPQHLSPQLPASALSWLPPLPALLQWPWC
jgi:hypothetical protein